MNEIEHVVILDGTGRAVATRPKALAHDRHTPLHLAFSCHVVDDEGRVLLSQRARTKPTWPGVWTNACCGHPQLGETLRGAVERRLREELGLVVERVGVALPDFTYRAVMVDGTVEHERCPVLVADVKGTPEPEPREVGDVRWQAWTDLCEQAAARPESLSPWSVEQIRALAEITSSPAGWLRSEAAERGQAILDREIAIGRTVDPPVGAAGSPTATLAAVAGPVDSLLCEVLATKAGELVSIAPALAELVGEIAELVGAGGKRLRPAFVQWGHRATGAAPDPAVVHPAAAVELLHTFALLHDDVMDRSATRRGRPTAHVALADGHRAAARGGDADWFGASAAILAGDLADVWADELLAGTPLPPDAVARARTVFTALRQEVIAGQHLDLLLAADGEADEAGARRVALLKSARYTVTRPLLLGAALAPVGDGRRVAPALEGYGDAVGLAFQLRDDVLGLFGDPGTTGKSDLDDLHEGKRTLLVLRARRLADEPGRRLLDAALGDPDLDEVGADRVREVVVSSGALASVEALLSSEHARALEAIDELPDAARAALTDLAQLAIRRSS